MPNVRILARINSVFSITSGKLWVACPFVFFLQYWAFRDEHSSKEFVCSVCNKSFSCLSKFEEHSASHSEERPFPCLTCNKTFSRSYHLKVHTTIRAHRDWPLRPKIENRDSHIWIFIGNWILMWGCFLHFFDLSTSSAAKMRFYFLHFLQGKNAQNRPENPQNWNLAKIGLKSDNFMK